MKLHDTNSKYCRGETLLRPARIYRMETMHYMDPLLRRRHAVRLMVGYVLVGCAIVMITVVLLFMAYGFGYKDGKVIQSGLAFLSSTPHPADIYIDGQRYKDATDTRLVLPGGSYTVRMHRDGYRDWQHTVTVPGGQVVSYVYPFLFPGSLTTGTVREYTAKPLLTAQSTDRRWLLVARSLSPLTFDLYDLQHQEQPPQTLQLPGKLLSAGKAQALEAVEWSADGSSVLLRHRYSGKYEYILLERSDPAHSVNLTKLLSLPTANVGVSFSNNRHDQFWVLDKTAHTLARASVQQPALQPYLSNVLAFAASGADTVLYATPDTADHTKVDITLRDSGRTYAIRHAPAGANYLLGLTRYAGNLYAAVSNSAEAAAYVYENPAQQISNARLGVAVPARTFHMAAPGYLAFSPSGQYVMFEHGTSIAVYDAGLAQGSIYTLPGPLDTPQAHVSWLDGARLTYVSGGQLTVSDYDGTNRQTLIAADARYQPYLDTAYKTLYALTPAASNAAHELLTSTSLRIPADQ